MTNLFNSDNLQKLGLMLSAVGTAGDPGAFSDSLDLYKMLRNHRPDPGPPDARAIETGTQAVFSGAPTMGYGAAPVPTVAVDLGEFTNAPGAQNFFNSRPVNPAGRPLYGRTQYR